MVFLLLCVCLLVVSPCFEAGEMHCGTCLVTLSTHQTMHLTWRKRAGSRMQFISSWWFRSTCRFTTSIKRCMDVVAFCFSLSARRLVTFYWCLDCHCLKVSQEVNVDLMVEHETKELLGGLLWTLPFQNSRLEKPSGMLVMLNMRELVREVHGLDFLVLTNLFNSVR